MSTGPYNWGPGARALHRRLKMNGSLVTTSPAAMSDDGETVESRSRRNERVDLFDEAIQLWQSHGSMNRDGTWERAGTWPPDQVIDWYVKYVLRGRAL